MIADKLQIYTARQVKKQNKQQKSKRKYHDIMLVQ